jgi:phosphoglycerate dehydrogenase-like enzyme
MWSLPVSQVERIRRALPHVEIVDVRDYEAARAAMVDADVALAPRMQSGTLAGASRLRWVHTTAVGVGWLPLADLAARGIPVTNARGLHAEILAEHAMALILGLRRQFLAADERRRARAWAQEELAVVPTPRLSATTVLVVGLGGIGTHVARYASGMGMRVIGVRRDIRLSPPAGVDRVVPLSALREWLPQVDIVVLALPHTAETGQVLGADALALIKPTALVINVARGSLIDEAALAELLQAGRIGGAGLDVFATEPLPESSPLWSTPRTIITPHTGACDGDYWTPAVDFFLENWARFEAGTPLENVVDLDHGY